MRSPARPPVQLDVKFIGPLAGAPKASKYYQFTAIDDSTRLRCCASTQAQPADGHPVPGLGAGAAPVPGRGDPDRQRPRVRLKLPLAGPGHRRRPCLHQAPHPRLHGKVERSHRIDAEEFYRLLDGVVIDDAQVFNDKLQEWEDFYNYHRPTAAWAARRPMKDSSNEPRPGRNRSTSVAQGRAGDRC